MSLRRLSVTCGLLLTLVACGDSGVPEALPSGASTAPVNEPTTTLDAFGTGFVEWSAANAADSSLTEAEARCLATSTLDALGEERLIEFGVDPDGTADGVGLLDGDRGLTPGERRGVAAAFDSCFADPWAWLVDTSDADELCVLDQVRDGGITLEQFLFAEIPEYEDVVGNAIVAAVEACGT